MRPLIYTLLGLLLAGHAVAQSTTPATGQVSTSTPEETPKGNAKITGYAVDSTLSKAVEFANVALYETMTGKLIDGTVADEKGKFTLTRIAPGSYRLLLSFLGYTAKTVDNIVLSRGQTKDIGVIRLSASTRTLNEVTIAGKKALVEDRVDRLVYNADSDLSAKGGDATDILKKVPMLSVDLLGNVSLQGSSSVRVLINNKPSSILAGNLADALRQIPADLIKTVEVITSPSAKYDGEGSGGIINIITKKNTLQGLHLDVDSGLGNRNATLGLNGSFRKGNLGVNLNGNGRVIFNPSASDLTQTTFLAPGAAPVRTNQRIDAFDRGVFAQYALGMDYDLAKNQSLTGGVRLGIRNLNMDQQQTITLLSGERTALPSRRDVYSQNLSNSIDVNVDYLHTYPTSDDRPKREFSLSTQYSQNKLTNNFDANRLDSIGFISSRQRNLNDATNGEFIVQADYQMPLSQRIQLELGGKNTLRQVTSDYQYLLASPVSAFVADDSRPSGSLEYDQNIAAAYLSVTFTTRSKLAIMPGLRYEYTSIQARTGGPSATGQGPISIPDYGRLLPSINLSRKIGASSTLKMAYTRRIRRPFIDDLNPNFNTVNPLNIRIGNPYLRPETVDRIELGYSTQLKKTYLNFSLYSRLNTDDIQSISQRSDTLVGAVVTRVVNLGKEYNYGSNVFATINLTPRWSVNANLDVMYRFLQGLSLDVAG